MQLISLFRQLSHEKYQSEQRSTPYSALVITCPLLQYSFCLLFFYIVYSRDKENWEMVTAATLNTSTVVHCFRFPVRVESLCGIVPDKKGFIKVESNLSRGINLTQYNA